MRTTLSLLLLPLLAQAAPKGGKLFNRMAAETTTTNTAAGVAGVGAVAEAAADAAAGLLNTDPEDMWKDDHEMRMLQKMLNGDSMDIFKEFANAPGLEEIWGNPKATFRILKTQPIFEGIKGVKAIMAKSEEELTKEDGLSVLASLRTLITSYTNKMAELSTSEGLTNIFDTYRNDPGMKDLFAAVDTGAANAKEASLTLQQKIADDVWGDLIDLNAFGLDGTIEPRAITESRDMVMNGEPKTWDLITQGDPTIKAILENPLKAAEILTQGLDPSNAWQMPKF